MFISINNDFRKRYVYMVHCPEGPVAPSPFIIDPSGAYIRREGTNRHYLCGISPNQVRTVFCFFLKLQLPVSFWPNQRIHVMSSAHDRKTQLSKAREIYKCEQLCPLVRLVNSGLWLHAGTKDGHSEFLTPESESILDLTLILTNSLAYISKRRTLV